MGTVGQPSARERHLIPPVASFAISGVMSRGKWTTLTPSQHGSGTIVVKRSTDGVTFADLAAIPGSLLSFSDSAPPTGPASYRFEDAATGRVSSTITITPPAAPSNLTAHYAAGVVSLSWTDTNPTQSTGFLIERSVNFADWVQVASVAGSVLTTTDTPPAGNIFFYRVRSTTDSGTSAPSAWALAGPAVYAWLRASDIVGVADGASIGATWVDKIAGHMTLTRPTGSTWTYKAAGIGGRPEVMCDTHRWTYGINLAQPYSILWVGEAFGPGVHDTSNKIWLSPNTAPISGLAVTDAQNPFNGFDLLDYSMSGTLQLGQCDVRNIWLAVINGAASSLTQQGVNAQSFGGGISSSANLVPGSISPPVGLSEFLVLSAALSSAEQTGINAAFSQLTGIVMPPGKTAPAVTPAFDTVIVPVMQAQENAAYDLGPRAGVGAGTVWYVSAAGLVGNDGRSLNSTWPLAAALNPAVGSLQKNIKPGDEIQIVGGTYRDPSAGPDTLGFRISLAGQSGAYIRVRPVAGQRVIIDGGLQAVAPAQYVAVEYLEGIVSDAQQDTPVVFGDPNPTITWPQGGFNDNVGVKFVWHNNVLHGGTEESDYFDGAETHIADNVYFGSGQATFGPRAQFHGNYGHNLFRFGPKIFSGDIYGPAREFSIHFYTEAGDIQEMYACGCVFFDHKDIANQASSNLIESAKPGSLITDVRLENCVFFNSLTSFGNADRSEDSATLSGNVLGGSSLIQNLSRGWANGFNRTDAINYAGLNCYATLRPHMYDAAIATLSLFGDGSLAPTVDLSGFLALGDTYRIMDVLDLWGTPLATGTYDGAPIQLNLPAGRAGFQCAWVYR
jgi:hypothetical protein